VPRRASLAGKVIVITGASRGLGREIALAAARRGAGVALAARTEAQLDEVRAEALALGVHAISVVTDVRQDEHCARLIARTVQELGGLDGLVLNAGMGLVAPVLELRDPDVIEELMRVNFLGAVACVRHALPHLIARRGVIAAISSLQGAVALPGQSIYAASKHALEGFLSALRVELRPEGVGVLVVSPGSLAAAPGQNRVTRQACAELTLDAIQARRRDLRLWTLRARGAWLLGLCSPRLRDRLVARAIRAD
jgi:NAD(P)-dependent dehydrogenase (short-subunit alcohol dehydrogenase family)